MRMTACCAARSRSTVRVRKASFDYGTGIRTDIARNKRLFTEENKEHTEPAGRTVSD